MGKRNLAWPILIQMGAGVSCFYLVLCVYSGNPHQAPVGSSAPGLRVRTSLSSTPAAWTAALGPDPPCPDSPCVSASIYTLWCGVIQAVPAASFLDLLVSSYRRASNAPYARLLVLARRPHGSGPVQRRVQFCCPTRRRHGLSVFAGVVRGKPTVGLFGSLRP